LVSATLAVTEKEAGVQPSLHSEVDANDLFCNSEETVRAARDDVEYAWSVRARKQLPSEG